MPMDFFQTLGVALSDEDLTMIENLTLTEFIARRLLVAKV